MDEKERNKQNRIVGIYFLYHEHELVYIGKSINCIHRIFEHEKEEEKIFDYYEISECKKSDLNLLEDYYIQKHSPKYNLTLIAHKEKTDSTNFIRMLVAALIRLPEIPNTKMTRQYIVEIKKMFKKFGIEIKDNKG